MRKKFKIGAVMLVASSLMFSACASENASGGTEGGSADGEPIKIGVVAALTGMAAPYGTQALNSFNLAVEDINEAGGVDGRPLEVVAVDNMSRPEEVPALMRRLASDGVSTIVGASSTPLSITAAQTSDQIGVPLVVPMEVAGEIMGEGREYVSKIVPEPGNYAVQSLHAVMEGAEADGDPIESAMLITASAGAFPEAREAWVETLEEEFPEVEIASDNSFDEETTSDFGPIASSAQAADPDLIIFGGNPQSAFQFYPALEESGWQPKATIGLLGGNTNAQFIPTVGSAAEGDIAGNYWTAALEPGPNANQTPQGFVEDYMAEFDNQVPDGVGAYYYASAVVVAEALADVEDTNNHDEVNEAIRSVEITGINEDSYGLYIMSHGVDFDESGYNNAGVGLVTQIVDGEYVPVYPEEVAAAPITFADSE